MAATNVGVLPMFVTGRGELIEAYLVDFDGDLYGGRPLRVEFLKRLRGEKRFASVDDLVEQMGRDVGGGGAGDRRRGVAPRAAAQAQAHVAQGRRRRRLLPAPVGERLVAVVARAGRSAAAVVAGGRQGRVAESGHSP